MLDVVNVIYTFTTWVSISKDTILPLISLVASFLSILSFLRIIYIFKGSYKTIEFTITVLVNFLFFASTSLYGISLFNF